MRIHADIGMARAASAPVQAPAAPGLEVGTWFEAVSAFGPLRLCVFVTGTQVRHAADAALALHRCEDLLGALDKWIAFDLAWRWSEATPSPIAAGSHARARWEPIAAAGAPRELTCLLSLPWALLRKVRPPGDALARRLHWPAVQVVLAVSQFRIDPDELSRLEPGGAVVLPDSLLPPWQGRLRSAEEPATPGLGVAVALSTPSVPRLARGGTGAASAAPASPDNRVACEVRLATPRALPGDRLTGWCEGEALGDIGPVASLWRCANDVTAACLASGRLMPWGDGWALALEATEPGAAAATAG